MPVDLSTPGGAVDAPWAMPGMRVAEALGVDVATGLTAPEAASRLSTTGPNDLPMEPPRSLLHSVLSELRETMIVVLLGAALLTAVTGDLADCAVILLVIAVDTTVGVLQERRAVGAVAALRTMSTPRSTVRRDGHVQRVLTTELVPGDVLQVAEGDVVGADARLITTHELQVDEALLTGESLPAARDPHRVCPSEAPVADRTTMLHAGTLVVHGTGTAVVVGTGLATQLGRIASLLHERSAPDTPLQRRLAALGRRLSVVAATGCAVVVLLGLLRGQPWELMVVAGISLAVAAIPESLPAVVALALAGGTKRMAARGAIVRSLPAVEALGSVTVLAADKTGTLTTGSISCVALWTPGGGQLAMAALPVPLDGLGVLDGTGPRALLEAAMLCNDARPGASGTEGALLAAGAAAGIDIAALREALPRTREVPFDSVRREMRTWHAARDGEGEIVKGAPEVVLPRFAETAGASDVVQRWTAQGRRVLAVAAGLPGAPVLLGLLALADPVRPEAREAVLAARAAGIRTIMITGDHLGTATAVARATGVLTGDDPPPDPTDSLRSVYARTDPRGKLDIVADWQRAGHVVAMTGDGVNDAPALRAADVGVAMGRRGTEVAKEAADLVLTDDSLGTVVAAVAEGRRVFDNIRRFVRYGLSGGLAEILVMLAGPILALPLPLLPGQILWVNLVTHGLPGVAIGAEQAEPDVLHRAPRPPGEGILTRRAGLEVLMLGSTVAASCLVLALWAAMQGRPWQTMLFATLALAQLGIAITTRSDHRAVWRMSPAGNPFLYTAAGLSVAGLFAAIYLPGLRDLLGTTALHPSELGLSLAVGALPAVLIETTKAVQRARLHTPGPGQVRDRWGRPALSEAQLVGEDRSTRTREAAMVNEHPNTDAAQVVVGTDGTETAARAVAWAASEARLRGVPLRILHAAPYATPENKPGRHRVTAILGRAYTVAHQQEPRVAAHTEHVDEQPVRALVGAARNAQLLVIGMRGEGPGEAVIGSTALGVSGAARCPVTVVRGQSHADTAAPVLLGLEDVAIDAPAVTAAFAAAQRRRAPLIVLHAQRGTPRVQAIGGNAAEGAFVEQLAPWRCRYPQVPVEVRLVHGGAADELLRAAATAYLVVVGTHGRGAPARLLLGSTSRTVVRYSPCPVMVVRWDAVVRDVAPDPDPATTAAQAGTGGLPQAVPLPDRDR